MKILAVDTTSKICSVAVLEDDKLLDEINLDSGLTHSENLMPMIKEILERNKLELKNLDLLGVDCGPGSFTGIRIGLASVKAIAEVWNLPVAEVTYINEPYARNVGYISYKKFLENDLKNADTVMPVYINQSELNKLKES